VAHFAELDQNNVVQRVIVVGNNDTKDGTGVENEITGIAFCKGLLGPDTVWKQTSYNGNIRKNYAGIGFTYDEGRDAFISPQPYPSWTLNETTCRWEAPQARPTDGNFYAWDEITQQWTIIS
jgi:hypothetical protein